MAQKKRKRRRKKDRLVLNLLIIVALVLVVFEGRLVMTMITHRSVTTQTTVTDETNAAPAAEGTLSGSDTAADAAPASGSSSGTSSPDLTLAGLPDRQAASVTSSTEAEMVPTVSNPDSPAIVPKADTPVDDSYFSDAVFIGDSRMEGFRNASGITQGQFFTSVGMSLSSMKSEEIISTSDGNITVAAALSGGSYDKIYIMLGTNDLGEYDWDSFREGFVSVTNRFQEIQPGALIYVCSVIYVEESKVASTDYVNNANVARINEILLGICEDQGYYYLDLNEFLTNGYGSLIEGATSDGVHIYPEYCKQMLDYLKSHYIPVSGQDGSEENETESETDQVADSV